MADNTETARNIEAGSVMLLTESYPCGGPAERTFVEPELRYLLSVFNKVIVVPGKPAGARCPAPEGVMVEEGYCRTMSGVARGARFLLCSLFSGLFWRELVLRPLTLIQPRAFARLVVTVGTALTLSAWLKSYISAAGLNPACTIIYSYWLGDATLAGSLLKNAEPDLKLISRAHGADVYDHRKKPPYFPCRAVYLANLDQVFTVSDNGRGYLSAKHPGLKGRIRTERLGVPDPGAVSRPSKDGAIRIVSCSLLKPVKRIDLLLKGVRKLAQARPNTSYLWTHIGGGRMIAELKKAACESPGNLKVEFAGQLEPDQVIRFYKESPVDILINVSSSEGLPVSMMEAAASGIPIAATNVGGVGEIVSERTGILMPPDPSPDEIAEALIAVLEDKAGLERKRANARDLWRERFDADANFKRFASALVSILDAGPTNSVLKRNP